MAGPLRIPGDDLKEVAGANETLVDVVKNLADLAEKSTDPNLVRSLYEQIEKLLGTSEKLNAAVKSVISPLMK